MTTTTMTTQPQATSTDTGFIRSLLWATATIMGVTMVMALLWSRAG